MYVRIQLKQLSEPLEAAKALSKLVTEESKAECDQFKWFRDELFNNGKLRGIAPTFYVSNTGAGCRLESDIEIGAAAFISCACSNKIKKESPTSFVIHAFENQGSFIINWTVSGNVDDTEAANVMKEFKVAFAEIEKLME